MNIIRLFTDPAQVGVYIFLPNDMHSIYADGFVCALGFVVAILTALILHEIAHGFVAYKCGDNTAKMMGRLSLNPMKHLDPFGTLCMLFVGFGWAKPVPINPYNFKNGRKGMLLVSVAGVATNIVLSFLLFGLYYALLVLNVADAMREFIPLYYLLYFLSVFCYYGAILNLFFCLFNILPFYPLDGFRVVQVYANPNTKFMRFMTQYSTYILFGLIGIGYVGNMIGFPYLDVFSMYLDGVGGWILNGFDVFWRLVFGFA